MLKHLHTQQHSNRHNELLASSINFNNMCNSFNTTMVGRNCLPLSVKQLVLTDRMKSVLVNGRDGRAILIDESLLSTSTMTTSYFLSACCLTNSAPSLTFTDRRALSWSPNWSLARRATRGSTSTQSTLTYNKIGGQHGY